jgi:acetolactate synthase-1/2/3 large subunit
MAVTTDDRAHSNMRSGGQLVVDVLRANEVDLVFCVPGESFLAVLDALSEVQSDVRLIVCRHEANATNMAVAYGKLTGKPGICFVTRGPGASHAAIGVHTASQDSTPLILFIGQVQRDGLDRESLQEIDYGQMFGKIAKWSGQIGDPARIPELMGRAFHTAVNGRPGPVVVSLPEDMLTQHCDAAPLQAFHYAEASPSAAAMDHLCTRLAAAAKPVLILGGGGWNLEACADVARFAEQWTLPVATGFRCQDLFDNRNPHYLGELGLATDPALMAYVAEADLLIVAGERLGEATTKHYKLLEVPHTAQALIHIHPEPNELGRIYQSELLINATMPAFARAVAALPTDPVSGRSGWVMQGRELYERRIAPPKNDAKLDIAGIVSWLSSNLPPDAIVTNGAGNYASYVTRYHQFSVFPTQLAPTSGAMGFGLPSAIAAQLLHPDRMVICYAGDGCLLMSSPELATLADQALPVIIILINNNAYGSIRMHQERDYPGRVFATDLRNPDFIALAAAYGIVAERIHTTGEFEPAFHRARTARRPTLIELSTDTASMIANNPRR